MIAGNDDWLKAIRTSPRRSCGPRGRASNMRSAIPTRARRLRGDVRQGLRPELYRPAVEGHRSRCSATLSPDLMVLNEADWASLIAALKKFDIVKEPLEPSAYYTNAYLSERGHAWLPRQRVNAARRPGLDLQAGPGCLANPPPGLVKAQALARAGRRGRACRGARRASASRRSSSPSATTARAAASTASGRSPISASAKTPRSAFPTNPPTDLAAAERDVLMVDVHPITPDGFWGDCTRCPVIGDYPEAKQALRRSRSAASRDAGALSGPACRPTNSSA